MSSVVDYSPSRRNYDIFEDSVKMGKLPSSPMNETAKTVYMIAAAIGLIAAIIILGASQLAPDTVATSIARAWVHPLYCEDTTLVSMSSLLVGGALGLWGFLAAKAFITNKENEEFVKEFKGKLESLKGGQSLIVISPYDQSRRTVAKEETHFTCTTTTTVRL